MNILRYSLLFLQKDIYVTTPYRECGSNKKPQDIVFRERTGPEVIKLFSCLTQLSMKFYLLINVKMPTIEMSTIVGILTIICRKNSILGLSEPENSCIS